MTCETQQSYTGQKSKAGKRNLNIVIKWRKVLYTVGITLGLGLLAQQAWQGYQALRQAQACVLNPTYLLGALGLYVVAYFVQMAAWALIMRALGALLPGRAVVEGYALSFLPRYIPGSVWGYLSRNEWLAQTHQVGYGVSTTASLLEAAMLLMTAAWLGALYWLPTQWDFPWLTLLLLTVGISGAWLAWQLLPWLAQRILRRNTPAGGKPGDLPGDLPGDISRNLPLPTLPTSVGLWGVTTLLYLLFWGLQGAALLAIGATLCGSFTVELFPATAAFALAWAIGFLVIFVPAGVGVREWTLGALLATFVLLQPGQATLIAVISRFGLIAAEVVVLAIGLQGHIQKRWRQTQLQRDSTH